MLVLVLLTGILCGCGDTKTQNVSTTAAVDSNTPVPVETEDLGTLGNTKWNGRTFSILGVYSSNETSFEICPEEDAGDNISAAATRRNLMIEDLYDVKIQQVGDESCSTNLAVDVAAGSVSYDLVFLYRDDMATAIIKHLFLDIMNLKYIDFNRPYYNEFTIDSMKIDDRLYHMSSDFSLVDKNRVATLFFNRDLAENHNIPDIISQVKEGSWTFENFFTYVKMTSFDKNGDGNMDYLNDQYGVTIGSKDESIHFWSAMGVKTVDVDGEGEYFFDYNSERAIEASEKVKTVFTNKNYYYASQTSDNYEGAGDAFTSGRALFYGAVMSSLPSLASEAEFAYTVLPYPKLDDQQQRYYSNNNNRYCATFGVPICAEDPDFSGFMIEALSWRSTDTTLQNYYEVNCKFRNSYDKDCSDMMDVLFDSLTYDFGFLYDNILKTNGNTPKSIVSGVLRYEDRSLTTAFEENGEAQKTLLSQLLLVITKD